MSRLRVVSKGRAASPLKADIMDPRILERKMETKEAWAHVFPSIYDKYPGLED